MRHGVPCNTRCADMIVLMICYQISPLIVTIGFLFKWWAIAIAYPFTISGSLIAFFVGRQSCLRILRPYLYKQHHLRTLRSVITEDPYKYCLLLRLSPIPLFVKNYGLAALGVPLKPYLYSSCISAIPWTTVEVALGCSANTIVEAWKSDNPSQYALRLTMLCSSVIIMCVVFTLIIRAYRRHMSKHLESITGRDTSTSSSLCNESSLPDSSFSLYDSPNRRSSSSSLRELIPHPHLTSITPPLVFNSTCPSPNAFKLRASTPSTPPTRHSTESQWKGDEDKGDLSENEDSGTSLLPAVVGATSVDGGEEGGREAGTGREEAGLGPE
eukprot:GHVQ01003716.1.p1 GENE.GHVQ01003716.1~~GHVQ01003716.1.p1  ORF type:complete len:327 (+),score=31.31 GHVQ01003716.1:124-1104(+)